MEILASAYRHGISADDIRHAVDNAIGAVNSAAQPDFTMIIGPDTAGRLLEIGILSGDDNDYVIHALPARPKYLKVLEESQGDDR